MHLKTARSSALFDIRKEPAHIEARECGTDNSERKLKRRKCITVRS
jgi:hypothetical protein